MMLGSFLISPTMSIAFLIIKYQIRKKEHVSNSGKGENLAVRNNPVGHIFYSYVHQSAMDESMCEKGINKDWSNVALVGLVFSSIIGIIVNGVTLYIIFKRTGLRQQSIFPSIFYLTFFDFLICAIVFPVQAHRFNHQEWPFGDSCAMQYIQVILVGLVTFTIGKIPFERPSIPRFQVLFINHN